MDGGLQILGKMCDELQRKREKNREERGKGKNRASSGVKGLCRTTFSTGSGQEPVLKGLEGHLSDNILPPLTLVPVRGTNRC